jgi:hypothetical protein
MAGKRHHGLIAELRGELALFARVCLLIVAIPMLYPLAQAEAARAAGADGAGAGHVICTQQGSATLAGAGDPPVHALDDCPCGLVCAVQALGVTTGGDAAALPAPLEARADAALGLADDAMLAPPPAWLRPPGRAPPLSV